jgi:leucyl/phenylalanyl-tRNA--protein transferase
MIPWLPKASIFPPVELALAEPNGLLAAGGDLSAERILAAYRQGIFPWFSEGDPILWWSPDPRMVLYPTDLRITRSLAKTLRNKAYEVKFDTAFAAVVAACATTPRAGQNGTWITPGMRNAYSLLQRLGHAHSVETWVEGQLVGGLYGVAVGKVFFGESMFSHVSDASKIALAHLCRYLERLGFAVIDCQMETAHLASLGARPIARRDFVAALAEWTEAGAAPGRWPAEAASQMFCRATAVGAGGTST